MKALQPRKAVRTLKALRPHQKKLVKELTSQLANPSAPVVVLAATTGAGKTLMATHIINKTVREGKRVLVMTHGQTILKHNFAQELTDNHIKHLVVEPGVVSHDINKAQVVVALPFSIHRKLEVLKKFDLLVVDEAHQYYGLHTRMYKKILGWHKKKQLLITASHYWLKGSKVLFSREDSLALSLTTDYPVKLLEVKEALTLSDFTSSDDVVPEFDVTDATYNAVLAEIHPKKKTMVVCHNTVFANTLLSLLQKKQIAASISTFETDTDNEAITAFRKSNKEKLLIVVAKGIIGFDVPELEIIIDASYTKNITRMEQLMGRLARMPEGKTVGKKYVKLMPQCMTDVYIGYTTAAMALGLNINYRTFTGNANTVRVSKEVWQQAKKELDYIRLRKTTASPSIMLKFGELIGIGKGNKEGVTLGNLMGVRIGDSDGNKKKLLEMASNGEAKPNQRKHKLGTALKSYTSNFSNSYDKAFTEEIKALRPDWFNKSTENKKQLLEMARNGESRPNQRKHELGVALTNYTRPSSDCCDKEFREELERLRPDWFPRKNKNK